MNLESPKLPVGGVTAVVVSYQPDPVRLAELLKAVLPQVERVVVVDNGSDRDVASLVAALDDSRLSALFLSENLGIAAAHNTGIRWARERGAEFVLLMDQDSVPDEGMVAALKAAHEDLVATGEKVAAVGPQCRDRENGCLSPHVRFGKVRVAPVICIDGQRVVRADFLISSGSLISMKVLDVVGEMDESLFIDQVDTEWILRARAKGYTVWGHCEAFMAHSLGEHRQRVWLGRWRDVPVHKPFRYYYMIRNSVLLQRRNYPCWAWRRVDTMRLLQMLVLVIMFHPHRLQVLRKMLDGLRDGIRLDNSR
jgi:rhamnosyltransferase